MLKDEDGVSSIAAVGLGSMTSVLVVGDVLKDEDGVSSNSIAVVGLGSKTSVLVVRDVLKDEDGVSSIAVVGWLDETAVAYSEVVVTSACFWLVVAGNSDVLGAEDGVSEGVGLVGWRDGAAVTCSGVVVMSPGLLPVVAGPDLGAEVGVSVCTGLTDRLVAGRGGLVVLLGSSMISEYSRPNQFFSTPITLIMNGGFSWLAP